MFKTSELQFKNKKVFGGVTYITFAHKENEVCVGVKDNKITELVYYYTDTDCDFLLCKCPYGFKKLIAQYL